MKVGSPEWFHEKANTKELISQKEIWEFHRAEFTDRFSPEKLESMSGRELLENVFENKPETMLYVLNKDRLIYRDFGAGAPQTYTWVLYHPQNESWKYGPVNGSVSIANTEAEEKAKKVRDDLIYCINEIENADLITIGSYEELENRILKVFFYNYVWVRKYFQMIYPFYFPGIYAKESLKRALEIIGLPSEGSEIMKAGMLSLFIRKCDINNIVFNKVYEAQWGWEGPANPCENATENYYHSGDIAGVNKEHYKLPETQSELKERWANESKEIDKEIDELHLEGGEREAVVCVRINQGEFRDRLIKRYGKCCLCGVSDSHFLIASHIKPWVESEPEEKLDTDNGFLLCPNHDRLFDQGFISFDDNGKIMISSQMKDVDMVFMNINANMTMELTPKNKEYLEFHRKKIFKN